MTRLDAARAGEPWALQEIFTEWNRPLTAFVRAQGIRDAGEVVNDVFLGAFRGIPTFAGDEAAFRAWIFRIARNKITDQRRLNGRRLPSAASGNGHADLIGGDVEAEAHARLGRAWMDDVLAELTAEQREVLLLRTVADLTIDQIAAVIGRRRGAVKQLQRRALRRLERVLAERPDLHPYASEQR